MNYLVIDLEMCKVPKHYRNNKYKYANEIIQVGAVLLDEEYEIIGKNYIQKTLKDKYGLDFEVYNINVKESKGSLWNISSGKYIPSMSAKASCGDIKIDIFASIREGDEICYDNYQKEEILKDFNNYILSLYKTKPTLIWANIFVDIDKFSENDGMNKIKYDGNIVNYLKSKNKEIDLLLVYEEDVDINNINDSISFLFNTVNKLYVLTSSNFSNENANKLMSNNKIDHFLPYIKNFICLTNEKISFEENNLKEDTYFYYKGTNEAFNSLCLKNVNIHIDMWRDYIDYLDEYSRISKWFWAEPNSTYYLKSEFLKDYSMLKEYYVFSKFKNENGGYVLSYEKIDNLYSDYIVFESTNEGWFMICEHKK